MRDAIFSCCNEGSSGCCKTDLHQTNEGNGCVSALLEGDFWRFSGEYGVFTAAEIKKIRQLC